MRPILYDTMAAVIDARQTLISTCSTVILQIALLLAGDGTPDVVRLNVD